MDPNEDTVRSMADLLKKSESVEDVDDDNAQNNSTKQNAQANNSSAMSRQDSIRVSKLRQSSSYIEEDVHEGIELEPSIITDTTIHPPSLDNPHRLPGCFYREIVLKTFVCLLFVSIIVGLVVIYHFYNKQQYQDYLGRRIRFNENTRVINIMNLEQREVLRGTLGQNLPWGVLPYDCTDDNKAQKQLCLLWRNKAQLMIDYYEESDTNCYDITWTTLDPLGVTTPKDCFELDWGQWFGGGLMSEQVWPINNVSLAPTLFVTGTIQDPLGPVLEKYWLTSNGVALIVNDASSLHVSFNDNLPESNTSNNMMCLHAPYKTSPFLNSGREAYLNYTMCVGPSVQLVHNVMLSHFAERPKNHPVEDLFKRPLWSTWGHFKQDISQSLLLDYAQHINTHQYTQTMLLIEDGWQQKYGDMTFDLTRFPDPNSTMQQIKHYGFDLAFWVHPFCNVDSTNFQSLISNKLAVKDIGGSAPGLIQWYNGLPSGQKWERGVAGVADMSSSAQTWFRGHLEAFATNFTVASFYFASGEVRTLPFQPVFADGYQDPNEYVTHYSEFASGFGQYQSIMHSAYRAQAQGLLIRLQGTESSWDPHTGIGSVIPRVLTLGLLGYPFILPDSIGGAGIPQAPSKELYIRWLQLTTFLPIMHFSVPPHNYDGEVIQMAKDLIDLHLNLVSPRIINLAQDALQTLHPIIRPLWWLSPDDPETFSISSQFMVGNSILVAPVIDAGMTSRDIYIPAGSWTDQLQSHSTIKGPKWLRNYAVPLNKVAYFLKADS